MTRLALKSAAALLLSVGTSGAQPAAPASVTPASTPAAANAAGGALKTCSVAPMTGWMRDGACGAYANDRGKHLVCAELTDAFLNYSREKGNDLITPRGRFPGLKAGDRWCLCASRWEEARQAGKAPPVVLEATAAEALKHVPKAALKAHAAP